MSRLDDLRGRIASREAHIGVIGLGYVGLPLALEFARKGFHVTGIDVNDVKVETLRKGASYIEDVPSADGGGAARPAASSRPRTTSARSRAAT